MINMEYHEMAIQSVVEKGNFRLMFGHNTLILSPLQVRFLLKRMIDYIINPELEGMK